MVRIFVIGLAATALLCANALATSVEITDQAVVNDLINVQEEIDAISAAVMSCMDSGKTHPDCLCDHHSKFEHFSATVRELFRNHPELKQYDLVHFRNPDGTITNQSLVGINAQAEMNISCD